jgi:hypothetical protein
VQGNGRLRLAWVNPAGSTGSPGHEPGRAGLSLVRPLPVPERPIKLDLAIERHLGGQDGLSPHEFLQVFSGRRAR